MSKFHHNLHVHYIQNLAKKIDNPSSYEGAVTEHLRMSGIYWSLTALSILVPLEEVDERMNLCSKVDASDDTPTIVDFVFDCFDEKSGGFGGNKLQDGHILYTLSAIQILALANALDDERMIKIRPRVIAFVQSLQLDDGSFMGDEWGEIDTRFSYCALSALSILGELHGKDTIDVDKAAEYIASCQNFDGGFGSQPGAESHAGQIFTCIGALSIACRLDLLKDEELLCWWLAERQCDSGGLNGRPEKQSDVCYSWWILSCLCILGKVNWIRGDKLANFILKCQDDEDGGIADRPGDMVDVFHTFFGIAGLSLIGVLHEKDGVIQIEESDGGDNRKDSYRKIDPVYALPCDIVQKLGLKGQVALPKDAPVDERLKHYDVHQWNGE